MHACVRAGVRACAHGLQAVQQPRTRPHPAAGLAHSACAAAQHSTAQRGTQRGAATCAHAHAHAHAPAGCPPPAAASPAAPLLAALCARRMAARLTALFVDARARGAHANPAPQQQQMGAGASRTTCQRASTMPAAESHACAGSVKQGCCLAGHHAAEGCRCYPRHPCRRLLLMAAAALPAPPLPQRPVQHTRGQQPACWVAGGSRACGSRCREQQQQMGAAGAARTMHMQAHTRPLLSARAGLETHCCSKNDA
jgi:hypothetical protein